MHFYRGWRLLWVRLCNLEDTCETQTPLRHIIPEEKCRRNTALEKCGNSKTETGRNFSLQSKWLLLNPTFSKVFLRYQLSRMPTLLCSFYQETFLCCFLEKTPMWCTPGVANNAPAAMGLFAKFFLDCCVKRQIK